MGLRAAEDSDYFLYIKAAVLSAKDKAPSLVPHLLYSGPANAMTAWFEQQGGTVLFHDLSFFAQLREDLKDNGSGPFLRIDVPSVVPHLKSEDDVELEYVLYTDIDVMFMQDITSCTLEAPDIFAIGGQKKMGEKANTGVMYINVQGFGAQVADLVAFGKEHDWNFIAYDQGLILAFFHQDKIAQLPDQFNWKGYWGSPKAASPFIIHWHGPKPRRDLKCLLQQIIFRDTMSSSDATETCKSAPDYSPLVWESPDRGAYYNHVLQVFEKYILQVHSPRGLQR